MLLSAEKKILKALAGEYQDHGKPTPFRTGEIANMSGLNHGVAVAYCERLTKLGYLSNITPSERSSYNRLYELTALGLCFKEFARKLLLLYLRDNAVPLLSLIVSIVAIILSVSR